MTSVPPPPPSSGEPVASSPVPPPPPPSLQPPAGYVAYGTVPTPTRRVHRIRGLARAIPVLVGVAMGFAALTALLSFSAADAADDFLAGNLTDSEFTSEILAFTLSQSVGGIVQLAAGIVVMIWMYRMASNLRAFGLSTTWHPVWAVFGWILPPQLYIIPLLVLRELWTRSLAPRTVPHTDPHTGAAAEPGGQDSPLLYVWFVCYSVLPMVFIVLAIGSLADQFTAPAAETQANTLADGRTGQIIGTLVAAIAGTAWIMFTRRLTARHVALTGER